MSIFYGPFNALTRFEDDYILHLLPTIGDELKHFRCLLPLVCGDLCPPVLPVVMAQDAENVSDNRFGG